MNTALKNCIFLPQSNYCQLLINNCVGWNERMQSGHCALKCGSNGLNISGEELRKTSIIS
jgi:hypothetical protein